MTILRPLAVFAVFLSLSTVGCAADDPGPASDDADFTSATTKVKKDADGAKLDEEFPLPVTPDNVEDLGVIKLSRDDNKFVFYGGGVKSQEFDDLMANDRVPKERKLFDKSKKPYISLTFRYTDELIDSFDKVVPGDEGTVLVMMHSMENLAPSTLCRFAVFSADLQRGGDHALECGRNGFGAGGPTRADMTVRVKKNADLKIVMWQKRFDAMNLNVVVFKDDP